MGHKFVTVAVVVCVLVAIVHSAPQLKNRGSRQNQYNAFQPQPQAQARAPAQAQPQYNAQPRSQAADPERQSRFLVVDDTFHQEPNGEYAFE